MTGDPVTHAPRKRSKALAIAAVVGLAAAFGWLIWGGLDKNVVFFLTPNELLARGAMGMNVPVRLLSHSLDNTHQARIAVDVPNPTSPQFPDGRLIPGRAVTIVIGEE